MLDISMTYDSLPLPKCKPQRIVGIRGCQSCGATQITLLHREGADFCIPCYRRLLALRSTKVTDNA